MHAKPTRLVLFAMLMALAAAPPAAPLDLQHVLTGYSLSSWVERDGVPLGTIRAIVQDRDGYLWLGTSAGLLRFDGLRFVTAEALGHTPLPASAVRALLISPKDGSLWMGFDEGGGVHVIRDGHLQPALADTPHASITALTEDRAGTIWAATDAGIYSHDGAHWTRAELSAAGSGAMTVYVDRNGVVWAGTSTGLFKRGGDGRFERAESSKGVVRDIREDALGRLWITDPVTGLRPTGAVQAMDHGHEGAGLRILHDRRANIWLGTRGQGLWRIRLREGAGSLVETATVETGLVANGVWDVFEDREGNIWVGSQLGLNRLTPHTVTPIADLGLVHSVESGGPAGSWIGTAGGLIHLSSDAPGQPSSRTTMKSLPVRALHFDGRTLWAATDEGLTRFAGRQLIPQARVPGLSLRQIRSLTGDGRGGLWLVDLDAGLLHWNGSNLKAFEFQRENDHQSVALAYRDREKVWVAFTRGRLGVIDGDGTFRTFASAEGLADGTHSAINAIAEGSDGVVWIGGTGGLTRYSNGRFVTLTREGGLPGQRVNGITTDARGNLWLAVDSRVVGFHSSEFAKAVDAPGYRIHHRQFDQSHGVAGVTLPVRNEGVARASDGQLWFVTGRGVTVIDPQAVDLTSPAVPPLVRIEGAVADDERFPALAGASLPPRTTRLRIDYTALQLSTPTKIRFRYRLDGFDPDWIDAGTRRQVFYMNLPPREYRFVVQTADQDGRWVDAGATWSFAIEPTFYQTSWFFLAVTATLMLGAYGAWQLHLRHVRREFALVLAERTRLSREIHDTLLQDLAGVAIQCVGISNALEPESPARIRLDTVRHHVEDSLRETRQAVWNLRAPILETHDLPTALREAARRITAATPVRFELTVSGRPPSLSARLENEILRIAQEAMTNAVRHAKATHVEVALSFGRDGLTLRVCDDGCGFDVAYQAADANGPLGLISMKERAKQLGGRLRVAAGTTGGTEVELIVPAAFRPAEA